MTRSRVAAVLPLLLLLLSLVHLPAQVHVSYRDEAFANPTGIGSPALLARVYYPSTRAGISQPMIVPPAGGYPTIVFLHGFASLGRQFDAFAEWMARHRYIMVMCDTAASDINLQALDGLSMLPALLYANANPMGFFHQGIHPQRIGLAGFSMGGANLFRILAINPGYQAGFTLAAWEGPADGLGRHFPELFGQYVTTPLFMLHGTGDQTVNWASGSKAYLQATTRFSRLKGFHLLDQRCRHLDLVSNRFGNGVFELSMRSLLGFFDFAFELNVNGLEDCLGNSTRNSTFSSAIVTHVRKPFVWTSQDSTGGDRVMLNVAAMPGLAALYSSENTGTTVTPFGVLELGSRSIKRLAATVIDPSGLFSTPLPLPPVGQRLTYLQGFATADNWVLTRTNRVSILLSQ